MSILKKDKCEKEVHYIMTQKTPWYMWIKLAVGASLILFIFGGVFMSAGNLESEINIYKGGLKENYLNSDFLQNEAYDQLATKIGYLDLKGTIMSQSTQNSLFAEQVISPENVIPQLKMFMNNDEITAVVLRINSPGGAMGPSEMIADYIKILSKEKPVYVYSDDLLASGGYLIAAPATKIFTHKSALVGSIGVITQFVNAENLLEDKLGIEIQTFKGGKYKDIGNPARSMNEEEENLIQEMIDLSYDKFISWVADNRNMSYENVENLATGWIYLGEQGISNGLVDGNGLFEEFVEMMKGDLEINQEIQFVTYELPKTFLEELFGSE